MPFIQNIRYEAICRGEHLDPSENSMLIQIIDPGFSSPWPRFKFKEVHKFEFYDWDYEDEDSITDEQAEELVKLLKHALTNDMNVIVHCSAGICRSGAVTEIGVIMGFRDVGSHRIPNLRVKSKMMNLISDTY